MEKRKKKKNTVGAPVDPHIAYLVRSCCVLGILDFWGTNSVLFCFVVLVLSLSLQGFGVVFFCEKIHTYLYPLFVVSMIQCNEAEHSSLRPDTGVAETYEEYSATLLRSIFHTTCLFPGVVGLVTLYVHFLLEKKKYANSYTDHF